MIAKFIKLPTSWATATFGEVISLMRNGTTAPQNKDGRGVAVSRIETIAAGEINFEKVGYVADVNEELLRNYRLLPGDVLFSHINSAAHLGKTAVYRSANPELLHGMNLMLLRPCPEVIETEFFHRFCHFHRVQGEFSLIAQHAVNQASINQRKLQTIQLPLPPLPEQRRIVAKIEALQERSGRAAKALEEVGPLLEQFRQSILAAAFSGRLTADWREKNPNVEPAHELLARIRTERRQRWEQAELAKYEAKGKQPPKGWEDNYQEPAPLDETNFSALSELPEGWAWTNLDSISHRVSVGHVGPTSEYYCDANTGVPFLRSQNVRPGCLSIEGLNYITREFHDQLQKSQLLPDDLLVVRVGANRGDTCRVPAGFPELNCANIVFARPCGRLSAFIEMFCQSHVGQSMLLGMSRGGAQGVINTQSVAELPIPICSYEEQEEILRSIDASMCRVRGIMDAVQTTGSDLTQLNQSILAKAFRGELVPQDPKEEPASELLARIRREKEVSGDRVQGSGRKKRAGVRVQGSGRRKGSGFSQQVSGTKEKAAGSPEPARPQRRRRSTLSNNEDASLVIRVLAEGGAVNIHADTSGPTVQFYTKSSGGSLLAEIEGYDDPDDTESQPHESPRTPNLRDLMRPEMALLYPDSVNPTYLPQLRTWHTWATTQIPDHFDKDRILEASQRWSEAFETSVLSTSALQTRKANKGRLFDA